MKPAPFTYHDPCTLPDALALLARLDNAKLLAGGQSLMAMMNMRYAMPDHVIDLNGIGDLAGISRQGDTLRIGAMTRQRDLEHSPEIAAACPLMQEALRHVGHRQTRNRGTLGGSLCHLDPAAELPAVCLAADATVHVAGANGARDIAMRDFALGFMTAALAADEIVTAVSLPARPDDAYAFEEFARRHGDFAIVGVAVQLARDGDGRIARAAIALCGIADRPIRATQAEECFVGSMATARDVATAAAAARMLDALSDIHASAAYRKHLAGVLTERALTRALARAVP